MAVITANLTCDLQSPVKVQYLDGNLFSQDNQGNVINVSVFDGEEAVEIIGTVSANVIRSDGGTVAVSGTSYVNVASVVLPQSAYAVPGAVSIIIKITNDSQVTTVAAIVANVYQSTTDTVIDPGTIIPSIQTLIDAINTAVSSIPLDYSSLNKALGLEANRSMIDTSGFYPGDYAPFATWENAGLTHEVYPGILKVDGTSTGGRIVNFLGDEVRYANSSSPSETQLLKGPFNITSGHYYRLSFERISGTSTNENNIYLEIYATDGTTVIASVYPGESTVFKSAVSSIGQFCYFTKKNTTWTEAEYIYRFEDVTEQIEQMKRIAPLKDELTYPVIKGQLFWYNDKLYRMNKNESSSISMESEAQEVTSLDLLTETEKSIANTSYAIAGGKDKCISFENGSASNVSGYLNFTASSTRARSSIKNNFPVLVKGDKVSVASGYEFSIGKIRIENDSVKFEYTATGFTTNDFTIQETGTYIIYVQKTVVEGETRGSITPSEANAAITIEHFGLIQNKGSIAIELPANPYFNIPWNDVLDVTSVSHAHCTTQEQFDTLKGKYQHIALSNYHPSAPWYPLSGKFTDVGNTIGSPNAEHAYFSGVSTHVHMNTLGMYLSDPTTNPYGKPISGFVDDALKTLKMFSGGGVTLNHPYWSGLDGDGVINILRNGGVIALEVWNATCERDNGKGDSSALWDAALSEGVQVYGVAVPDHEAQYHPNEDTYGFGYNHMLVMNATEEEILNAYRIGRFYATLYNDGLTLEEIGIASGTLSIEVSEAAIFKFVTATRTVTTETASTTGTFEIQSGDVFVRVEATRGNNKLWTNAIIL